MGTADAPGDAHVTTFTTDGRLLDTYAHYAESEGGRYHQYRVASADLASYEGFRDGYRMLRNAQDGARETSYQLRDQLLQAHHHRRRNKRGIITIPAEEHGIHRDNMPAERRGHARSPSAATVALWSVTTCLGGAACLAWPALFLAVGVWLLLVRKARRGSKR